MRSVVRKEAPCPVVPFNQPMGILHGQGTRTVEMDVRIRLLAPPYQAGSNGLKCMAVKKFDNNILKLLNQH